MPKIRRKISKFAFAVRVEAYLWDLAELC